MSALLWRVASAGDCSERWHGTGWSDGSGGVSAAHSGEKDEWSSGVRRCVCAFGMEKPRRWHTFFGLNRSLHSQTDFLMIKVQPEGWFCHKAAIWTYYFHPPNVALEDKNAHLSVLLKQNTRTLIDFVRLCFIIQQPHLVIICILKKSSVKNFFEYFFFLFISRSSSLLQYKLMWIDLSAQLSPQSLLPVCVSHPLPCQLRIVLEDCKKPVMARGIVQNLTWDSKQSLAGWRCTLIGDNNHQFVNGTPYLPRGLRRLLLATKQHGDTSISLPLPSSTPTVNRCLFSKVLCTTM